MPARARSARLWRHTSKFPRRPRSTSCSQGGDISEYIDRHRYDAYARENVETYSLLVATETYRRVVVLSSGFMTYAADIHLEYRRGRREIEQHPNTFVLLPSFNREVCVAETVRRQIARPFGRSPAREEAVIRKRFEIYMAVPARKIETMRPVPAVVEALVAALGVSHPVDQLDRLSATIG